MLIHVSQASPKPMYEQVVEEIQRLIVTGEMAAGEPLPSIRELSKELTTSGITIRRAYQELERIGFIYTRAGKGSFIARLSEERLAQWKMEQVREPLWESVTKAKTLGLDEEEFQRMIAHMWREVDRKQRNISGQGETDNG